MDRLDKIIDLFLMEEKSMEVREYYRCDQDGYDILFDPVSGEVVYQFDNARGQIKHQITIAQRTYYLESGYWISVGKPTKEA